MSRTHSLSHSCSLLCSTLYKVFLFVLLLLFLFFFAVQAYFTLYNKIFYIDFIFTMSLIRQFFLKSHNEIKKIKTNKTLLLFSEEIHNKSVCLYK